MLKQKILMKLNKIQKQINCKYLKRDSIIYKINQICEVLNSYKVGQDGLHYFYEVILVDRAAPEIKNDRTLKFVSRPANKARALRALTSAGQKARGQQRNSREKAPKAFPSLRAHGRRGN